MIIVLCFILKHYLSSLLVFINLKKFKLAKKLESAKLSGHEVLRISNQQSYQVMRCSEYRISKVIRSWGAQKLESAKLSGHEVLRISNEIKIELDLAQIDRLTCQGSVVFCLEHRTKIMVRVSNESASTHHRWEETPFTMTEVDIENRSTASRWISRQKPQFYYSSILLDSIFWME